MMHIIEAARRAAEKRRTERALYELNWRGITLFTVKENGEYARIYVRGMMGPVVMSPRTARLHLKAIREREIERALCIR